MYAAEDKIASHWVTEGDSVRCGLCPHRCLIEEGTRGICRVRENRGGTLYALTYGKVAAVHVDPIEKKPLFHFHPGSHILSIGAIGCNFSCGFCQNHLLVEGGAPLVPAPIPHLVRTAREGGSIGVAYTYNEPMIWFEFVLDCSRAFREAGMVNVLVTNGFISPDPLRELLPVIDAMNIDLKSMDPQFYRKSCGGMLPPVLETIRESAPATHVEVTNLMVTGENDSDEAVRAVVDFIAGIDPEIPLHLSRYFPQHRYTAAPTPTERLVTAWRIAREKLPYVYVGNVSIDGAEDTLCPRCRAVVIRRRGYRTTCPGLAGQSCASCGAAVRIVV